MAWIAALIGSVVAGGTSYYNAQQGKKAAEKASEAERQAAERAAAIGQGMYAESKAEMAPWVGVGKGSLISLADLMGQRVSDKFIYGEDPAPTVRAMPQKGDATALQAQINKLNQDIFHWGRAVEEAKQHDKFGRSVGDWASLNASREAAMRERDRLANLLDQTKNYDKYLAEYNTQKAAYADWGARQEKRKAEGYLAPKSSEFGALNRPFTMEDFYSNADPGYEYRLGEGVKALDRSAAARGNLFGGAQIKGLTRFAQDYGSNEYANAYNRYVQNQANRYNQLANLAGLGQTSAAQVGGWGQQTAANMGNAFMAGGAATGQGYLNAQQARASGYTGMANAANQFGSNYLAYQLMQNQNKRG